MNTNFKYSVFFNKTLPPFYVLISYFIHFFISCIKKNNTFLFYFYLFSYFFKIFNLKYNIIIIKYNA